ncbi:MAG: hypothetical protein RIM72_11665 [Alphaproteobacteria bacterium]
MAAVVMLGISPAGAEDCRKPVIGVDNSDIARACSDLLTSDGLSEQGRTEALLNRAYAYVAVGRARRAQREILALIGTSKDGDPVTLASVVRELATTADPHRHGQLALRLIEESEPIALDEPTVLEAVAAAYAADRKFDYAVRAQYQALKLAEETGDDDLPGYRVRFELYKLKQALVCPGMPECW